MNLTDARVLLTGSAGGIGSATAARLAQAGAKLVLADINPTPLDRLAVDLGAESVLATVAADLGSEAGRAALAAAAREHHANVLINAAGINPFGLFIEQTANENFEPNKYKDTVRERVLETIQRKVEGQDITADAAPEAGGGKIIDLMEALKASLGNVPAAEEQPKPAKAAKKGRKAS